MHTMTPARRRRRARRPLLAAALAALALPAGAQAGTLELGSDNTLEYRAGSGETNSLVVTDSGGFTEVQDGAGVTSRTPFCVPVTGMKVRCGLGFRLSEAVLGDRNDLASIRSTTPVVLDGGVGDDMFFAGMAPTASRTEYRGNQGNDTLTYASASAGAVMLQDEQANDGRPNRGDQDNVRRDIERFIGSPFADRFQGSRTGLVHCLTGCSGSTLFQRFSGGLGDDIMVGGLNSSEFVMGGSPDGADTVLPGVGFSIVDYRAVSRPVTVTVGHGTRDDGPAGDGDDIGGAADLIIGGSGADVLTQHPQTTLGISLNGGPGADTLNGGSGNDGLDGGPGRDTLLANGGNDFIFARDGESDVVGCGTGLDTAQLDAGIDGFSSCENRPVGTLALTPAVLRVAADETARVRLSWRHPRAWRRLASIELRVMDGDARVGAIRIDAPSGRISADGAVRLAGRAPRLTRDGRTVGARLALRLEPELAGRKLRADVEATDRSGARQVERGAAAIRVTR